ncbi:MAG: UTP--glucose-1-phosphate uridylyltransferase [Chloroflexi bacterium]|nr:UTP--glucose-1-phosphate uridylyltransferase [Chloroflexota bacterium]
MTAVRKGVILAAGLGTRMLPATKAVPKEMLPIVDKPLVQYAVEEAVAAGIDHIVFVIADGKEAIAEHFSLRTRADAYARERGEAELIERVCGPASLARFDYVRQDEPRGIAHAVACAREFVEGEPFALIFPDDIITGARSCMAQLVDVHQRDGGTVIAVQRVRREEVPQYGIVDPEGEGNPVRLRGVVEKPAAADAPSDLGIVGRYILSETIFAHIDRIPPGKNGELQITDAIASQIAAGERVSGYAYEGVRHDTGRPLGYLVANVAVALERGDLAGPLAERLRTLLAPEGPQTP